MDRGDLSGGPRDLSGVDVHVTPFIDGGVYAGWSTTAELRDSALDLIAQGIDYADPPAVPRHCNAVLKHIQTALPGILVSAAFEVAEPDRHGHGHGSMIQVKGFRS
ncbi:hypothetical protein ACGFXB_01520 [Streptomyces canus]|uniref:hypothetical protein n=1 Tax=Streptomyces canus TaxID=58343 RepID=UPI00372260AE